MNFEKYYCYNSTNNEYFKQCLFEYFYYKKNNPNLKFVFMIDKESFKSDEGLKDIISLCKKFLASNVNR